MEKRNCIQCGKEINLKDPELETTVYGNFCSSACYIKFVNKRLEED